MVINNLFSKYTPFAVLLGFDIFCCLLMAVGVFLLLLFFFDLPYLRQKQNLSKLSQVSLGKGSSLDLFVEKFATKLERFIRVNPVKRQRMLREFNIIGLNISPEHYYAKCFAKGLLVLAFVPVGFLIHAFFGVLFLIFAVLIFMLEYNSVDSILNKRKESIERELPRFVSIVEQTVKNDRDVIKIIQDYIGDDETPLCKELRIVLADMKTGDYEAALMRFAGRINSSFVNETCRGLVSTMRGDNTESYFEVLNMKLWEAENIRLEREALKKPSKVKFLVIAMFACMAIIYIVVFGYVIADSLKEIFEMM